MKTTNNISASSSRNANHWPTMLQPGDVWSLVSLSCSHKDTLPWCLAHLNPYNMAYFSVHSLASLLYLRGDIKLAIHTT